MAIEMSKFMSENIKEEKPLTIKRNARVRNMLIIIPDDETSQAMKECMRQIVYCSLINKGITELPWDSEKYFEYRADDDVELYKDSIDERSRVFDYPVKDATELRNYFEITSTEALDEFWKKFKEISLSRFQGELNGRWRRNNYAIDNYNLSNTATYAFSPYMSTIDEQEFRINCLYPNWSCDSSYGVMIDNDKSNIVLIFDTIKNNGLKFVQELAQAYPELEFELGQYLVEPCHIEKNKNSGVTHEIEYDIDDIILGYYRFKSGQIVKGITTNDIECDLDYPKQLVWRSIISDEEFVRCLNPECNAVYEASMNYRKNCYVCKKKKFGYETFKGLHPMIKTEFPLLCRITCSKTENTDTVQD
jgi:hypothetical protein